MNNGSRNERVDRYPIDGGSSLSTVLSELELCGFVRKFSDYTKAKYGACCQLIDPFILFCNQTKNKSIAVNSYDINIPLQFRLGIACDQRFIIDNEIISVFYSGDNIIGYCIIICLLIWTNI